MTAVYDSRYPQHVDQDTTQELSLAVDAEQPTEEIPRIPADSSPPHARWRPCLAVALACAAFSAGVAIGNDTLLAAAGVVISAQLVLIVTWGMWSRNSMWPLWIFGVLSAAIADAVALLVTFPTPGAHALVYLAGGVLCTAMLLSLRGSENYLHSVSSLMSTGFATLGLASALLVVRSSADSSVLYASIGVSSLIVIALAVTVISLTPRARNPWFLQLKGVTAISLTALSCIGPLAYITGPALEQW